MNKTRGWYPLLIASGVLIISLFIQTWFLIREEFAEQLFCWLAMTISWYYLVKAYKPSFEKKYQLLFLMLILVPLFSLPVLSNDAYRFLWDGELWSAGINPYDYTPNELAPGRKASAYWKQLYEGMGALSRENYSCYPVLNQVYFRLAAMVSNHYLTGVVVLRLLILLTMLMAWKPLIRLLKATTGTSGQHWTFLLHPLLIIEVIQNLHFEGVMISFMLIAIDAMNRKKWAYGALALSMAVQIKLLPLLVLPFLLRWLGWATSIWIGSLCMMLIALQFIPLLNLANYAHFLQSLNLYFQQFEFNSALLHWYIEYGRWKYGYNRIQSYGPYLSQISAKIILILAWYGSEFDLKKVLNRLFWAFVVYNLFTGTLHPWYLLTPMVLAVFCQYRFVFWWGALSLLSYVHYAAQGAELLRLLSMLEYSIVFAMMLNELYRRIKSSEIQTKSVSLHS